MKKWVPIVAGLGLLIAGASAFASRMEGVVLGFALFLGGLLAGAIGRSSEVRKASVLDQVSNADRSRLLPLVRLQREIEDTLVEHSDRPVVKAMAPEVRADAQAVVEAAVRMLQVRGRLQSALRDQGSASAAAERLERDLESASSDAERETLRSAIEATRLQQGHIEQAAQAIESMDANLAQAQAVLSELKSRLALAAAGSESHDQEDMRETISRLEGLTRSIDEAEQVMRGQL